MPSLPRPNLSSLSLPRPNLSLGRRAGASDLVGLDIQPGYVAAVRADVNGSIVVRHAAGAPLAPDTIREGEVLDESLLAETLRQVFRGEELGKRVRLGIANQRTVLRVLELPPVTDRKELAAAVRFQAEDQIPMPLANAVLDFHSLGMIDTPNGERQRVVVVAAQRDMVEKLLSAVRAAGLRPEGVDLSAFALIRSLYRNEGDAQGRVLYLNVGGLTNMAIAEGLVCRFTRVVGAGLEAMAAEVAERRGIPLTEARELLSACDLRPAPAVEPEPALQAQEDERARDTDEIEPEVELEFAGEGEEEQATAVEPSAPEEPAAPQEPAAPVEPAEPEQPADADVRLVLENGIREIVGDVRNSLDFHRAQDGGGDVASVVLSGPALALPGFAELLEGELGLSVRRQSIALTDSSALEGLSAHHLTIAAGLAAEEVHP